MAFLRGEGVSTLLTYGVSNKVGNDLDFAGTPAAVLAEDVLFLRHSLDGGSAPRALAVLKMRFSGFDPALHSYSIGSGGFNVGPALGASQTFGNGEER